jgi:2-keto-4-pentenoate hydratase
MQPDKLAEKLMQARLDRTKIALTASERPDTWQEARATADLACLGEPHAWKLGGTTQPVRDIFGISVPFYGPIGGHELFENGDPVSLPPLPDPVVEPEIAVRLSRDVEPRRTQRSDAQVLTYIDAVAPALDIAAVALQNPAEEGVLSLIADRAGAGLILVGNWHHVDALSRLRNQSVRLLLNGSERSSGGEPALIGGVLGALRDFFAEAARENRTLTEGDIVATGGLAPAIPLGKSKNVTAAFDGWDDAYFELVHGR